MVMLDTVRSRVLGTKSEISARSSKPWSNVRERCGMKEAASR